MCESSGALYVDLLRTLRENGRWHETPSPAIHCQRRAPRLGAIMDLLLTIVLLVDVLLIHVELIGSTPAQAAQTPLGPLSAPVTMLLIGAVMVMMATSVWFFASYVRFIHCHSFLLQLLDHRLGTTSEGAIAAIREALVVPLSRSRCTGWMLVTTTIATILTPAVVRSYSGNLNLDVLDLGIARASFVDAFSAASLVILLLIILVSEWEAGRHSSRYYNMSDDGIRETIRDLVARNLEKTRRWIRTQIKFLTEIDITEEVLDVLTRLWFEEYFFRDSDSSEEAERVFATLTRQPSPSRCRLLRGTSITLAMSWFLSAAYVVLFHPPAPSII
ncbi:MAG: hypothetical protein DRO73_04480 [Candidatus Thorarchaeota archaeon]|nr:MAG: hypothetical protein DRO73_04480 [Candidatus Thorarchaeota archaeon]RLI61920.1 MAG: hypothetical protein DRO93_02805 [Candidatus Thorarchaeota archaeon]